MENVVDMFVLLKDGVKVGQLEGNSTGIWDRKGPVGVKLRVGVYGGLGVGHSGTGIERRGPHFHTD